MSKSYIHVQQYEKEMLALKEQGLTKKEIAERLGLNFEQVKGCLKRYRKRQSKLSAGIVIKPKGRPRKDKFVLPPSVEQLSKLSQLQYELASKERHIKQLEMENELMRDFLSLTERK